MGKYLFDCINPLRTGGISKTFPDTLHCRYLLLSSLCNTAVFRERWSERLDCKIQKSEYRGKYAGN